MALDTVVKTFDDLARLAAWGRDHLDLSDSNLDDQDLEFLSRSAQAKKLGSYAIDVYHQFSQLILGLSDQKESHSKTIQNINLLLNGAGLKYASRFLDVQESSELSRITTITDGNDSVRDDDVEELIVPLMQDPRALVLPKIELENGDVAFINGFDLRKNTLSFILPTLDEQGHPIMLLQMQKADTGEVVNVRKFGVPVYADESKGIQFYGVLAADDSPVYALKYDSEDPSKAILHRYPSYSAAGFEAPMRRSTVFGYRGSGQDYEHYFADVFINHNEKIELAIIENADGEIEKVADFRLGQEYIPQERRRFGQPTYHISDNMDITLTRRLGSNGYFYQVDVFHNLAKSNPITKRGAHLRPTKLTVDNANWIDAVDNHVTRLKSKLGEFFHPRAFRKELYQIRNTDGMRIVHEVIMALYHDEETQMHVVNALKDIRGALPLPADTRIIPASADALTSLMEYLTQTSAKGEISKAIVEAAKKQVQIPGKYIVGLWLATRHRTIADQKYLERGASTPEYVVGGYPVGAYRRIVDESYSVIANTHESRVAQRERVLDMLNNDAISASFKHYLGYHLELAEEFDLLLLDSGYLFHNDKRVNPLGFSEDHQSLRVIDLDGEIFEIPRLRPASQAHTKPLTLSEESLSKKKAMSEIHPDDPFKFVWLTNARGRFGGSFTSGTILLKDSQLGEYRRPSAPEISNSMTGLLELPKDFLGAHSILPVTALDLESIQDLQDLHYTKGKPYVLNMGEQNHGFEGVKNKKVKMVPYEVEVDGKTLEFHIPSADSKTAKVLAKKGYYVASEADLPKIVKYYLTVSRLGYLPDRPNLYLMPGMMDGGILGFYLFKDERMVISSRLAKNFEDWSAKMFFNTIRHEMAHAIHRINPWITSMIYRCMALDGVSMDYGRTHVAEYWSVLVQNFFDHPQNRFRFPNGYRLIYTLIKMRELGVRWDGPYHLIDNKMPKFSERNIDGTYGSLRTLATGGDPFELIKRGGPLTPPTGGNGHVEGNLPVPKAPLIHDRIEFLSRSQTNVGSIRPIGPMPGLTTSFLTRPMIPTIRPIL